MMPDESPELPKKFYFDEDTLVEVTQEDWDKAKELTKDDTCRETVVKILRKIAR
jgi:hypothetical protein